jgi:transposase
VVGKANYVKIDEESHCYLTQTNMGYRLRVFLTPEQDRTLRELRTAQPLPQQVRDRAEVIRLNGHGWVVEQIAEYFDWEAQTVRETMRRWQERGLGGLWDAPKPGGQRRWEEAPTSYLEDCLRQDPRRYSAKQLVEKLAQERNVHLSPEQVRQTLRQRG